jgi:hypothetical protein
VSQCVAIDMCGVVGLLGCGSVSVSLMLKKALNSAAYLSSKTSRTCWAPLAAPAIAARLLTAVFDEFDGRADGISVLFLRHCKQSVQASISMFEVSHVVSNLTLRATSKGKYDRDSCSTFRPLEPEGSQEWLTSFEWYKAADC